MINCEPPQTVYIKINPCCTLIKQIPTCEDIGDSLTTIQFNFQNLDAHVCSMESSAATLWDPAYTLVRDMSGLWSSAAALVQSMSAAWNNARTTVQTYSAAWLDPISVIYPAPLAYSTSINVSAVSAWATSQFPVTAAPANSQCLSVNYAVGQRLWVFIGKYNRALQTIVSTSTPTAHFQNALISVYNTTINFGAGAYYNQAWLGVGGEVWSGVGSFRGRAQLLAVNTYSDAAAITGSYTDQYIGSFGALEFVVNTFGHWQYVKQLY